MEPLFKKASFFKEDTSKYPSKRSKSGGANKNKVKGNLSRIINIKCCHFARTGTGAERKINKTEGYDRMFKNKELKEKVEAHPYCYLTGDKIDLMDSQAYSLDHIVPKSKGGDNSLANCGLTTKIANQMKSYQTLEELIENCKKVLEVRGYKVYKI